MSYDFIEPLTERPKVKKVYKRASLSEQIIKEFQRSNVKYAKVSLGKIKDSYKSTTSCARAIGRVLKSMQLDEKITVYSDDDNVYLERIK